MYILSDRVPLWQSTGYHVSRVWCRRHLGVSVLPTPPYYIYMYQGQYIPDHARRLLPKSVLVCPQPVRVLCLACWWCGREDYACRRAHTIHPCRFLSMSVPCCQWVYLSRSSRQSGCDYPSWLHYIRIPRIVSVASKHPFASFQTRCCQSCLPQNCSPWCGED